MSLATPQFPLARPSAPVPQAARRVLLLGGTRSGKSAVAEAIVSEASARSSLPVRYLATARSDPSDPSWAARIADHRARRPSDWTTEELSETPNQLAEELAKARPDEILLVDDLGCWLASLLDTTGQWDDPHASEPLSSGLADAVANCPSALLVLVSPEVGLSVVASSESARTFADANGTLNSLVAAACDAVGLVVAGRTVWFSAELPSVTTAVRIPLSTETSTAEISRDTAGSAGPEAEPETSAATPVPAAATSAEEPPATEVTPRGFEVRPPADATADQATARLLGMDVSGHGLGELAPIARFASATQDRVVPEPWRRMVAFLLHGDHMGSLSDEERRAVSARRLAEATSGAGALALLAAEASVLVTGVECPVSEPIEDRDALSPEAVESALDRGADLADRAIDEGADLLIIASCGAGSEIAAMAVTAMFAGGEPATLIPRADLANGRVDDEAWMNWCLAARDALYRTRDRERRGREMLAALGGGDLAVASGIILRSAERRTPVMIDGPVGAASALIAREIAGETPRWLLLADHGGHPTTKLAATVLSLPQLTELRLGLGEGCTSLVTVPLLQAALLLAKTTVPAQPEAAPEAEPGPVAEPEPETGPEAVPDGETAERAG